MAKEVKMGGGAVEALMMEAAFMAMIATGDELMLGEVLKSDEREKWEQAMEEELTQLEKFKTWKLVKAPPGANVIPSMYVFR